MGCCHACRPSETARPHGIISLARQVPDLEQALERCTYAESIAADLLDGTGDRYRGLSLVVAVHTRERITSTNERLNFHFTVRTTEIDHLIRLFVFLRGSLR